MIESTTFEEATVEKLAGADVVMAFGYGDPNAPAVLIGRRQFVKSAKNPAIAAETKTLRVKVGSEQELAKLIARVKEAKGELDSDVTEIEVLPEPEEAETVEEPTDGEAFADGDTDQEDDE